MIDPERTVAHDVALLLASPKISPRITAAGYVDDLDTGRTRLVVPAAPPTTR